LYKQKAKVKAMENMVLLQNIMMPLQDMMQVVDMKQQPDMKQKIMGNKLPLLQHTIVAPLMANNMKLLQRNLHTKRLIINLFKKLWEKKK
jgi:hypothetical protein